MKKKHTKINCWEFMSCGREPGGVKVHELGICPAAMAKKCHGIHDGKNGGRACWAISGTLCDGKLQGTIASKSKNCLKCPFYQEVLRDCQGKAEFLSAEQIIAINHSAGGSEDRPADSRKAGLFTVLVTASLATEATDLLPFLKRQGCQVLKAANLLEVIDRTARRRPDLIILPIVPPGLEEFSTYALLRRLDHGRTVPVIFLGKHATPSLRNQGFKIGALDVIASTDAHYQSELGQHLALLMESKVRQTGLRALVIGGSTQTRQMVGACLAQQGVAMLTAANADEALALVADQSALDLIIAEVGVTKAASALCQALRSVAPLKDSPLILLCPERLRHKGLDFFQAGASDYILIPCPREELQARLLIHIESRQALRRLAQESRKNSLILDSAGEGIIGIDQHGQITFANQAAARMLGYLPDDMQGKNLHGLAHHTTAQGVPYSPLDCPIQKSLLHGEVVTVNDDIFWRSDNSTLPVKFVGAPIQDSDGINGAVVTFRDITGEKREEAIRQDMERITRHDLKTPLNGIIAIPDLLLGDDNLNDRQRRCLGLVKEAGQRMLKMINEALYLHKMENGTYELAATQVDLQIVILSILGELVSAMEMKGLEVKVSIDGHADDPAQPFLVCGEKLLCYSILENLIKNAIEASPDQGQIAINLCHGQPLARIVIHNQGVVPQEIQERFFDKYTTAGKVGGTGLGTYSAKLMTETQHGTLTMTSTPEQGTVLTLMLPAPDSTGCP